MEAPTPQPSQDIPSQQQQQAPEAAPPSFIEQYKMPLAVGGIIFIVVAGSILFAAGSRPKPTPPPPVVYTTPTPTPTPVRELSPLASQSAFLALEQSVASLSGAIGRLNIYDNTLAPPVLDLPLGFKD